MCCILQKMQIIKIILLQHISGDIFFFLLGVGDVEDLEVDVSDSESESLLKKSTEKLTLSFILSHTAESLLLL